MLIGIDPCLSPELLKALCCMGHGDELLLADAFFPGDSMGPCVIRADGIRIPTLLQGILRLINLDTYVQSPIAMMAPVPGDTHDPAVLTTYRNVIDKLWPGTGPTEMVERFAFYGRAKKVFTIVMTGETTKYANIIIKKGVIPLSTSDTKEY